MPTYYSVKSAQTLELRRGGYGEVEDPVLGKQRVPIKPLKLRFVELYPPFPVYGLPAREGLARGILTPEIGAAQIRRAANELGGAADNLPERDDELVIWVNQKLSNHPMKGALFVEVQNADEETEGDPVDDNVTPPPGMTTSPIGVIVRNDKGRAHCKVCNKSMAIQGVQGHSRSKIHIANLRVYEDSLKQASGLQEI